MRLAEMRMDVLFVCYVSKTLGWCEPTTIRQYLHPIRAIHYSVQGEQREKKS